MNARRDFGNIPLVKEVVREGWGWSWIGSLARDLRYGFRQIRRHPSFSAAAILTLSLGICAATVLFGVTSAVLLKPLPYPESDRLVRLWDRNLEAGFLFFSVSVPNYLDWVEETRTFDHMGEDLQSPPLVSESQPFLH